MTDKDNVKKVLALCANSFCDHCPDIQDCYKKIKLDARELIAEQEKEIERLKAENEELTKVVSSKVYDLIDNTKEIADAREAWEKQAKIDVLNELTVKAVSLSAIETYHICNLVDELLKEYEE